MHTAKNAIPMMDFPRYINGRQNHNTYKVLENLENKKWIRYNKDTKKYGITELGNTARAMLNLRAEKLEKSTSKKRGRRSETVE